MAILGGIDEAGLGPILGPLALGYVALRVPEPGCDPWATMVDAVSGRVVDSNERLVVADSKLVFTRDTRGHVRLERTALAFLGAIAGNGLPPADGHALFEAAPPGLRPAEGELARHPWYAELGFPLPLWVDAGRLAEDRLALDRVLGAHGLALPAAGVHVLCEGHLNDSFARTGSKSVTLWMAAAGLIEHLWERFACEGLELVVDRQGGRLHYGRLLAELFPYHGLEVLSEKGESCEYLVAERGGERRMRLVFRPRAESESFAVALASCLAKYAREVGMAAFNRYFTRLAPSLKPTAGYLTDARRWLLEARGLLERAGLERGDLVRSR